MTAEEIKEVEEFDTKELEARAEIVKSLEAKEGKKVHDLSFKIGPKEVVRLFVREPVRLAKMKAWDLAKLGKFAESSEAVLISSAIKEVSDARIFDDDSANDTIYMTVLSLMEQFVGVYIDALKKKN